jgi:hypothetical protein
MDGIDGGQSEVGLLACRPDGVVGRAHGEFQAIPAWIVVHAPVVEDIAKLQDESVPWPLHEAYDHIVAGDVFGIDPRQNLFQCVAVRHDGAIGHGNPLIGIFIDETGMVIGKHARGPLERA